MRQWKALQYFTAIMRGACPLVLTVLVLLGFCAEYEGGGVILRHRGDVVLCTNPTMHVRRQRCKTSPTFLPT